ncbi:hypothetical protein GCM10007978_20290 [Shewanella hanedai]|uniref:Uncharacterized protein n=1 Tax=Shewanella hanedai TaxID=25 RepID=A0A553JM64_SHEHA|nr:hypothetical protein [Shewanella hanedai]TRY13523.1 hypothetical protein FN961_14875 [Shewanella hanedai]GGI82414.1 hypothetical protein GCM10007978_20290 [Shewanella hanedai]
MKRLPIISALILTGLSTACASAHQAHTGGIKAEQQANVLAPFDIIHTKISTEGNTAIFHIAVSEKAGSSKPTKIGKLAGSEAFAYVWPTNIDSYEVGFEHKAGILALAVATHPDFDDTPLFDENRDGKTGNDGNIWHTHWVVLQPNERCGKGALGVVDIPEGSNPRLPKTWPGLPILLDSPGWQPTINDKTVEVRVPFDDIGIVNKAQFDGVTAGLRINVDVHAPLFCVVDVFDIASGDLSLPGKVNL